MGDVGAEAEIRSIEQRDAIALAALRIQQDRERGHGVRPGFIDDYANALVGEWDHWRGWIAEFADGRPVGCLLAQRVAKLPWLAGPDRAEWWYVQQVFVSADVRRQGIGRRLINTLQLAADRSGVRWVNLRTSDAGRPLFEAAHFLEPDERLLQWRP